MKITPIFKKYLIPTLIVSCAFLVILLNLVFKTESQEIDAALWKFQSIDTMKYSRDVAREKLSDASFNIVIDQQVKQIADTGATHVAIATPYDEEFYPMLARWTTAARKYHLNVWFRGNWAGWEGWFGYPKITRNEHIAKTKTFIETHESLFMDGDVFTGCPECENGGPGDPRLTGDTSGHRKFLIDEYAVTKEAFRQIDRDVASNFESMNGDVARLIMDKATTKALDGIVTVDHYVATPEKLIADVEALARDSGGKVVLGEFGAPIPDINGEMTQEEQAAWMDKAFRLLAQSPHVYGVNYWTNRGSSTALWDDQGKPKKVVAVIKNAYDISITRGRVVDETNIGIGGAGVFVDDKHFSTDANGYFSFPHFGKESVIKIDAKGYESQTLKITTNNQVVQLKKTDESFWFQVRKLISNISPF